MKYIIFDIETTGLRKEDEVIQFSCIITDKDLITETFCNFYCYTQQPISPGAFNTHHISKEDLHRLSGGKSFEDNWEDVQYLFNQEDVVWVDWSMNGFDQRMINQTLVNNGLDAYFTFDRVDSLSRCASGRHSFDLMHAFSKKFGKSSMKLEEAARKLPYNRQQIDSLYRTMINKVQMDLGGTIGYHHADYDAFITYLVMYNFFS